MSQRRDPSQYVIDTSLSPNLEPQFVHISVNSDSLFSLAIFTQYVLGIDKQNVALEAIFARLQEMLNPTLKYYYLNFRENYFARNLGGY